MLTRHVEIKDARLADVDAPPSLLEQIRRLAERARAEVGAADLAEFRRLKWLTRAAEWSGRLVLLFLAGHVAGWIVGMGLVAFYLAVEAQLNHTLMHGALCGVPGAPSIESYETLALPFRTQTWRRAHQIHHANPSSLERDPDALHPLLCIHPQQRPGSVAGVILGLVFVFELWALDYDRFLKAAGQRNPPDPGEWRKLGQFFAYQYLLFPLVAGLLFGTRQALLVAAAGLAAVVIRNFVFLALQLGSSVGAGVSTRHADRPLPARHDAWVRFQIETSKNFRLPAAWQTICGGLDRHIEHHLFPHLPPRRLRALSAEVQSLCTRNRILYEEHESVWASLNDSVGYLTHTALRR